MSRPPEPPDPLSEDPSPPRSGQRPSGIRPLAHRVVAIAAPLPHLSAGDVLRFAVAIGTGGGLAEAARAVWRQRVAHFPTGAFTAPEVVWMAPLAAATTLVAIGVVLIVLDRIARAKGAITALAPAVFTTIAGYSFLRGARLGIGTLSAWILAIGVATLVARTIAARPSLVRRGVRVATPLMAAALAAWAVAIPMWRRSEGARALASLPPAREGSPNVLLVIWDTARALNLSLYGYERPTTPELERFAKGGTVFEQAFATAPWTLPSHASMYTGRYPTELSAARQIPLDGANPTLAEVLARNGYATASFMANIYYGSSAFGLSRGFAWYDDRPPIDTRVIAGTWWASYWLRWQLRDRVGENGPSPLRPRASHVNGQLLRWIDATRDRPFFAVVNHLDAHDPYYPPPPFNTAFWPTQPRYWLDDWNPAYTDADLRQLTAAYDGAIRYLDAELGKLLAALRDRGVLDNTLVIVTSDHGEEFGEHGPELVKHARSLYAQALHVPLVIVPPRQGAGRIPAEARRREQVSIRDIPATVMDLLALPDEHPFPGTSLARYANGSVTVAEAAEPRLSVAEASPLGGVVDSWPIAAGDMFSVVAHGLHYIVDGRGGERLFDLVADPHERNDLAPRAEFAPHLARFRATLDSLVPAQDGARRAYLSAGDATNGAPR